MIKMIDSVQHIHNRSSLMAKAFANRKRDFALMNKVTISLPVVLSFLAGSSGLWDIVDPCQKKTILTTALAVLAGLLTVVHQALGCERYQAACVSLSKGYAALALECENIATLPSDQQELERPKLLKKLLSITESTEIVLPKTYAKSIEHI